jgi:NAD-dependent deacetylase
VVWFNEGLDTKLWSQAARSARECDVLLVVGTSGVVRPVSGLPQLAREHGAWVCEVNPQATELSASVHLSWRVSAAQGLPALIQHL